MTDGDGGARADLREELPVCLPLLVKALMHHDLVLPDGLLSLLGTRHLV